MSVENFPLKERIKHISQLKSCFSSFVYINAKNLSKCNYIVHPTMTWREVECTIKEANAISSKLYMVLSSDTCAKLIQSCNIRKIYDMYKSEDDILYVEFLYR